MQRYEDMLKISKGNIPHSKYTAPSSKKKKTSSSKSKKRTVTKKKPRNGRPDLYLSP
jgi:hypothetical protein